VAIDETELTQHHALAGIVPSEVSAGFAVETVTVPNNAASPEFAADGQGFVSTRSLMLRQVHFVAGILATALAAVTIGGCAPTLNAHGSRKSAKPVRQIETISKAATPLPHPALLRRQPEPDCAFRGPVSDPITAEETRQKLDYQQQCYRQAETIVRARLKQLQDSLIKAERRR